MLNALILVNTTTFNIEFSFDNYVTKKKQFNGTEIKYAICIKLVGRDWSLLSSQSYAYYFSLIGAEI